MTHTLTMQYCEDCRRPQFPTRELCGHCLSPNMGTREGSARGILLSWTRLHVSMEPYFQERLPCLVGQVRLENGLMIMAHLDRDAGSGPPQSGADVILQQRPGLDDRPAYFAKFYQKD